MSRLTGDQRRSRNRTASQLKIHPFLFRSEKISCRVCHVNLGLQILLFAKIMQRKNNMDLSINLQSLARLCQLVRFTD